jgi:hypothetical protein
VKINNLDTCCEQVGRRGKDYKTKIMDISSNEAWAREVKGGRH